MPAAFTDRDAQMLRDHLHALAQVEFFTIPLYLTAVYSLTDAAESYSPDGGQTYPLSDLQQKTLSVAVQEMYHLQGAFNLASAFDVVPQIRGEYRTFMAGEVLTVPHLEPGGEALRTMLGNLPSVIDAMIAVEKPDEDGGDFPPPNREVEYPSIGDLYHATLVLLEGYLATHSQVPHSHDPHFMPGHHQVAYPTFQSRYQYNAIDQRTDVTAVANAIADQGEGREVMPEDSQFFRSGAAAAEACGATGDEVECAVLPEFQPKAGTRFAQYDGVTHFCRFLDIQKTLLGADWPNRVGGPVFYEADGHRSPDLPDWARTMTFEQVQDATNTLWSYLVDLMVRGFQDGTLGPNSGGQVSFSSVMTGFKYAIPLIWQFGHCPSWVYRRGVTVEEAQQAMDTIDPLCLFHWDEVTAQVRADHPDQKNACQGLNQCKGLGWGGLGTQSGDGACATADFHTCQGGNSCSHQGGCGFLSTDPKNPDDYLPCSEQWIPGANTGASTGGCQTPIGTLQVFDRAYTDPSKIPPPLADCQKIPQLTAHNVWDEARNLLAQRLGTTVGQLPTPKTERTRDIDYDGTKRREAVAPTSR